MTLAIIIVAGMLFVSTIILPLRVKPDSKMLTASKPTDNRGNSDVPALEVGYFEENRGQVATDIRYYSTGSPSVAFRDDGVMFFLEERTERAELAREERKDLVRHPNSAMREQSPAGSFSYLIRFTGANKVTPVGREQLSFSSNFFLGNDSSKWRTGVPNYKEVAYRDLYDGIDLVYRRIENGVKYEFVVSPGVDPGIIKMRYEGVESVRLDSEGLAIRTALQEVRDSAPYSYQANGETVRCGFVIRSPLTLGFDCDSWDKSESLVIDPLVYSTYLGGGDWDSGYAIDVDQSGNAYVMGVTQSFDFPLTPGVFNTNLSGGTTIFLTKFNASGNGLIYSTFLGGSDQDSGEFLVVDSGGDAYLVGYTRSADFPTTPGAFNTTYSGISTGFILKLNSDGSQLLYSTFLGRTVTGIAIDSAGDAYVTGGVDSADFPTTPGAFDTIFDGATDVFVSELNPDGNGLLYSTFLGGTLPEVSRRIAVDSVGNAYVDGITASPDFPTTIGAFDDTYNGGSYDAFVTKLNSTGSDLLYSTFLGGDAWEEVVPIIVDCAGNAYVAGETPSADFPTTLGAFNTTKNLYRDVFVTKLNSSGSGLLYSTFLGGNSDDSGYSMDVDLAGNAYVVGRTESTDFPTTQNAFDDSYNGGPQDAFITELSPGGNGLINSTYFGGSGNDAAFSVAVSSIGKVYLAGPTFSDDFPTTFGAFDTTYNVGIDVGDAFVAGVRLQNAPPLANAGPDQNVPKKNVVTLDGTSSFDSDGDTLEYSWSQTGGPSVLLGDSATATPSFIPLISERYDFALTVSDRWGAASEDSVAVVAVNHVPKAEAGPDRTVGGLAFVTLDGSLSLDSDGDALTYYWFQTQGPNVSIINSTMALATFLPTMFGTYGFELTVDDGDGSQSKDTVNITVNVVSTVRIITPIDGSEISSKSLTVAGTSTNSTLVQVRMQGGDWHNATGVSDWQISFDLSSLPRGQYIIEARSFYETIESVHDTISIDLIASGETQTGTYVLVGLGVTGGVLGTAFVFVEHLHVALLTLLAILGAKFRKEEDALENEKRGAIRGYLTANPGANYVSIKNDLGMARGTLVYHLYVMEKQGLIKSWRDSRLKRFALSSQRISEIQPKITDIELIILQTLRNNPKLTQQELAEEIGVKQPTVSYHMKKLTELGFLKVERHGIRNHYAVTIEKTNFGDGMEADEKSRPAS